MWNLLSNISNGTTTLPSSLTGTFITSGTINAYDMPGGHYDDYPYSTAAILSRYGSAVAGVGDISTAVLSGFPSISKANFGLATLQVALSVQPSEYRFDATDVSTAGLKIELSYNGGSTWTEWKVYGIYKNGVFYPFTAACYVTLPSDVITRDLLVKTLIQKDISSSLFSTGLSDLQLRFSGSSVTSTSSTGTSSASFVIYDCRVLVS